MIPMTGAMLAQPFTLRRQPSRTYRLFDGHVRGTVDGLEAVKQAVYCILNTERFRHEIYSWNYGAELGDLYGQPPGLLQSKIKKRIREALTQDDRIRRVDAFSFSRNGSGLSVTFTVTAEEGVFQTETEVMIDV